jgi:hypothetical protein
MRIESGILGSTSSGTALLKLHVSTANSVLSAGRLSSGSRCASEVYASKALRVLSLVRVVHTVR